MKYTIVKKTLLAPNIYRLEVSAPEIARRAKAGQFVVLRVADTGERIPLTITAADTIAETITLIFQDIGKTTVMLAALNEADVIKDILGPLGHPTEMQNYGTVVAIAGGVGAAELLPVVTAFKAAGSKVITIIGARNKDLLILEPELTAVSDKLIDITDDGSSGQKGFVSNVLMDLIAKQLHIDMVYAIGPIPMMQAVSGITKTAQIKTIVSLNPIMLDGTGMCGVCRVSIAGETKFACVDGPEFDAHAVNWVELMSRLSLYKKEEKISLDAHRAECKCQNNDASNQGEITQ
ncbi:MAG: sulfide/dihydroorotate dehydrogenase-like FAD/NAD-binding protein [Elusimicrobia bacterium]|nr:sulfide/dihydroorotate dehydrogenase-like FAD/NAD-binding protein [Elusimicrobiota bacterium]